MLAYDGLVDAGVVVAADLGVGFPLFFVVGTECLFRQGWNRSNSRLGHGEIQFSRS